MHSVIHQFLAGTFNAVAVWMVLTGSVAVIVGAVLAPLWREQLLRIWVRTAATDLRQARAYTGAERSRRRADEMAEAVARAHLAAQHRHAGWVHAAQIAEHAWEAFERADAAAHDALAAARYAVRHRGPDGADRAGRRRLLRRLAIDAHLRGELSDQQFTDVLAERDGWDPDRHPADLEVKLRCAIADHRFRTYREAAAVERTAWQASSTAHEAKAMLEREARAAVRRVGELPTMQIEAVASRTRPAAEAIGVRVELRTGEAVAAA